MFYFSISSLAGCLMTLMLLALAIKSTICFDGCARIIFYYLCTALSGVLSFCIVAETQTPKSHTQFYILALVLYCLLILAGIRAIAHGRYLSYTPFIVQGCILTVMSSAATIQYGCIALGILPDFNLIPKQIIQHI